MYVDDKIWIANDSQGEKIYMLPKYANRHGLVAGATGTGKTVTLKVMAESFSEMGVPVFLADVKGDLASIAIAGEDTEDMQNRIQRFGLTDTGFRYRGYPVNLMDLYGQNGIPLRTTISEMGPLLLSRIMELNALQSDILTIVFKIADDNGLLLIDTKDLKAMLNYVSDHHSELEAEYGKMSPQSLAAIVRAVVALELAGGEQFFGEPAFNIQDLLMTGPDRRGMVNILDSSSLINNPKLYSTFLLWLLSELFETLPEVGDLEKPKLVFFFDEAHLLFQDAPKALLDKIEHVVKLIRSKGVGVYFCTQNPRDIPEGVLAQLGNKVEHALHAYTPAEQKAVKAAAESFRINPEFNTYEAIMSLGIGEAVVSFLEEGGMPGIARKACILPPESSFGGVDPDVRAGLINENILNGKYYESYDPDSAYEFLIRMGIEKEQMEKEQMAQLAMEKEEAARQKEQAKLEEAQRKEQAKLEEAQRKELAKIEAAHQKELYKEELAKIKAEQKEKERAMREEAKRKEAEERKQRKAMESVGNTMAGTIGREVGKQAMSGMGSFGKRLGGNVGASIGRGIFDTLFKK